MNHQLHAAGFVEEPLENHRIEARQAAERRAARAEGLNELQCRGLVESDGLDPPTPRSARFALQPLLDFLSESRDSRGKLFGAARCLTQPERNGRRLAVRILDP